MAQRTAEILITWWEGSRFAGDVRWTNDPENVEFVVYVEEWEQQERTEDQMKPDLIAKASQLSYNQRGWPEV